MLPQGEVSKNVPLCLEAISMLQKVFIKFVEEVWRLTETSHEPRQRWRTNPTRWRGSETFRPVLGSLIFVGDDGVLGLIECVAPVGQKFGNEGVFLIRLHG